ncbi:hypothetical protein D1159_11250 [Pseudoflavonifractor sp. 524-17]|uniref:hypothetical protein n=1 Tax=Pseudoflavonifractor sp. 524-17 TaxID=2304577 RepID=UPI00137A1829|nr:hypothetical protein [Pseudoflavonifractor sp. 524-17]NCE65135.1 hypothetical protein [Pseudoflavonifractor sp. 524-17]
MNLPPVLWKWAAGSGVLILAVTVLACVCAFGAAEGPSQPDAPGVSGWEEGHTLSAAPDLNGNGVQEMLRLYELDGGLGQRLEVWENETLLWSEEGNQVHMGHNAVFLCTLEETDYLLRYSPYMNQGIGSYAYELFTLSERGEAQVQRENTLDFSINFQWKMGFDCPDGGRCSAEDIAAFMDEVNHLLAHSVQLLNTDTGLLATFEREGRLYDSLGWLDRREPVFARDPSQNMLENLRSFQAAMEQNADASA